MPTYVFSIEVWLAKISFQNLISIKSYRGKTFGGVCSTPLDQEGLKILEIPLPYENSFNQDNNPYNHEKFIGICSEYGVSNDLTKWRNQKYFSTWQSRAWETGKPGMSYINENSFSRWIIEKLDGLTMLGLQKLSETVRDYTYLILTSQTSMRGPIIGHEA